MSDQPTNETVTQPTLFDVEVPKHVNMAFLYAALQAAQTKVDAQDQAITSLQKQVKGLFARAPKAQPDTITKEDVLGETKPDQEFLCTTCTKGSGVRTTHSYHKVANQHLDMLKEAERNHGKPPKRTADQLAEQHAAKQQADLDASVKQTDV